MKKVISVSGVVLLCGCANFDSEAFNRGLAQAYAYDQSVNQPRVEALNYQSQALAARNTPLRPTPVADFDWDWDQFYNQNGQLVWACRGVQTAQFAEPARCAFKPQTDLRWPAK